MPDVAALRKRFAPSVTALPSVNVQMPAVGDYDALLGDRGDSAITLVADGAGEPA